MPNYTYTDGEEEITVIHNIDWQGEIIGGSGVPMWRKPPANVGVNWGGLKPSDLEGMSPEVKQHLQNANRNRADYERNKNE